MTRSTGEPITWRPTCERCPHCGCRGLLAQFKGRRLLAENCPDCGRVWWYKVRPLPVRP